MHPKSPTGLELLSRYIGDSIQKKGLPKLKLQPKFNLQSKFKLPQKLQLNAKPIKFKLPNLQDPLNNFAKDLSSRISKFTGKGPQENYNEIVKGFIPRDAMLIMPKFPSDTKDVHFADLDGDKENELIASYKQGEELRTIVLKKQNGRWEKAAQLDHPGYQDVNFRSINDITGEGRNHLLIGLSTKGKYADLYGYRLEKGNLSKMFVKRYHRFEIVNSKRASNGSYLAVWNLKDEMAATGVTASRGDAPTFNIDVFRWNGTDFEAAANPVSYYQRNVIPYYAQKVRTTPKSASNWYNLAAALVKGGAKRDALDAIKIGMRQDSKSEFKDNFTELRNSITF